MKTDKVNKVKKIFIDVFNREIDPDWSQAANAFIAWNVGKNFQTDSFNQFVDWLDDDQLESVWVFFFGYYDDYAQFAADWVDPDEQQDYLNYALNF